jgi:hypothetical protein
VLYAAAFLKQGQKRLAFDFNVRQRGNLAATFNENPAVWQGPKNLSDPLNKCLIGNKAWEIYTKQRPDSDCQLSGADVAKILETSFPFANKKQQSQIMQFDKMWHNSRRNCFEPKVLLGIWENPMRVKFLGCGGFGCSTMWQSRGQTPVVYKRTQVHTSAFKNRHREASGIIKDSDILENWVMYSPKREYKMLEALGKANISVKAIKPPEETRESVEMNLVKIITNYIPPVGEQYWTFGMQAAQVTLQDFCQCGGFSARAGVITEQVFDIFKALKDNEFTHGDLHLGNIMILPDESIRLIDCGYTATNVFEPRYDRAAFTVSCTDLAEHVTEKRLDVGVKIKLNEDILDLRDTIYARVNWYVGKKGSIQYETANAKQPMIVSVAMRNRYFYRVYRQKMYYAQIQQDGPAWCKNVGLAIDAPKMDAILSQFAPDSQIEAFLQSNDEFIGRTESDLNVRTTIKSEKRDLLEYFTDFQRLAFEAVGL